MSSNTNQQEGGYNTIKDIATLIWYIRATDRPKSAVSTYRKYQNLNVLNLTAFLWSKKSIIKEMKCPGFLGLGANVFKRMPSTLSKNMVPSVFCYDKVEITKRQNPVDCSVPLLVEKKREDKKSIIWSSPGAVWKLKIFLGFNYLLGRFMTRKP